MLKKYRRWIQGFILLAVGIVAVHWVFTPMMPISGHTLTTYRGGQIVIAIVSFFIGYSVGGEK